MYTSTTQPSWTDNSTTLLRKIAQSVFLGSPEGGGGGSTSALDVTNAQKLALTGISVGQVVHVSDGFVVSGFGNITDGLWAQVGSSNGKPSYGLVGNPDGDASYDTEKWVIDAEDAGGSYESALPGNEDFPWLATWTTPTLTHPAVQQLAAPSTAQGGVFVSGGTQDGVWKQTGTQSGKPRFELLGDDTAGIYWEGVGEDDPPLDVGGWLITGNLGIRLYYSLSDVATPDLATNWKNASDDTPASITVASVTQGELDAGVTVAGAGDATANGVFVQTGATNGARQYGDSMLYNNGDPAWLITGGSGGYLAPFSAHPWGQTFTSDDGTPPAPTVTRNDIAAEVNWDVVGP